VRLSTHLTPWLRGRGWAPGSISSLPTRLLIFEGVSSVLLPREDGSLVLEAQHGLRVLQGDNEHGPMTILGHGDVELTRRDGGAELSVRGNDGFLLHVDDLGQNLRLGPAAATASHQFEVRTSDLHVAGSGTCRLFRPTSPDVPGLLELSSDVEDLVLTLPESQGALQRMRTLTTHFDSLGIRDFDARGAACVFAARAEDGEVKGTAAHIWSSEPDVYHLEGHPAELVSDRGGTFEGNEINIVRLSESHVLLEAILNARLIAHNLGDADSEDLRLDMTADRILYVPFLAPQTSLGVRGWPLSNKSLFRSARAGHPIFSPGATSS